MAVPAAPNYEGVLLPGSGGIRIPTEVYGAKNAGGGQPTIALVKELDIDVTAFNSTRGVAGVVTLYPSECQSNFITFNNSSSNNVNFALPAIFPGQPYTLSNKCGNSITFLVTGKTGVTLANNNTQDMVCSNFKGDILAAGAAIAGA